MELKIPHKSLLFDLSTDPPTVYSGKKLDRLSNGVAGGLYNLDLDPKSSIGLLGVNSASMMIAMLGMHKTQHVCVPINYKLPQDKIHHCINDSDIKLVFCDAEFKHLVPEGIPTVEFGPEFDKFVETDYEPPAGLDPNRTCLSVYTSGTTGLPKRIMFSLKDRLSIIEVVSESAHKQLKWSRENVRTLSANPLFHNAGISWFLLNLLLKGTIFLLPTFNAQEYLKTIDKYKITSTNLVPPMMAMMLNETELLKTLDLSSIKEIIFQASLADASMIQRVKDTFVSATNVRNPYGLTETGTSVFGFHPDDIPTPPGSTGYPLPTVRTKLVDDVLYVKSEDLLSKLRDSGEEYFNTRDRFRVDEQGFYYYIGRADDMLKCGGEKVFPIEIESVLNQHPSVIDSVVIGLDDDVKGQKPYAFVKLSTPINETYLLSYASSMLAPYQIPKRIWFLDNFPINEIGKIDKKTLTQLAQQYIIA